MTTSFYLPRTSLFALAACVSFSGAAAAQQFQHSAGAIPGPNVWTEGVECADVDRDGDLDAFYATGDGFASPGGMFQNVLLINRLIETGSLSFVDESVARLGVNTSHAKMVFTGDVDADGWIDAMFANAFNSGTPNLYMNRGAAMPGVFDEESAARGFTVNLNSASGQFGDLDDDGDLDLILNHSGSSYFGGAGGQAKLYFNDGTGNFTEQVGGGWSPPAKRAQMDVQLVDIDNDLDLDFFGSCRSTNSGGDHYLMLNDGTGSFTNISSSLTGTNAGGVYEAEVGDLDGDSDLDFFFVSLSGFNEGAVRNNLVPSGSLTFTPQGSLNATFDDNEIVLIDYDDDGDLDPLVGSLDNTEGLWRNDGGLSFTNQENQIQSIGDSTLDATVADLDNDGDYDLLTGQGESSNFLNRLYLNTGPADTRGPVVTAVDPVMTLTPSGPWIVKARAVDAVIDDNVNYLTAKARYAVGPPSSVNVSVESTSFSPASITVPVGTSVIWTNNSAGFRNVTSTTDPYSYTSGPFGPGALYEHCYVTPGVYTYTSTVGAFNGTVTVTGTNDEVDGTYVGGGFFRFEMTGSAGAGEKLVYELSFTDYVGNEGVSDCYGSIGATAPGDSFCNGDGGDQMGCTDCPCMNNAAQGTLGGCLNSAGTSSQLISSGSVSIAAADLRFEASGVTPNNSCVLTSGNALAPANAANPCFGLNSGITSIALDGLRCAVQGVLRHGVRPSDASGDVGVTTNGWGTPNGFFQFSAFMAGDTKNFQIVHRDDPAAQCMTGQNTSQAISLMFGL